MAAHYDDYDYLAYWEGREYENAAEEAAIEALLDKIPKIKTICEVGAGFGRLIHTYSFRAKNIIVSDPSGKLLSFARAKYAKRKNIKFVHSTLENLPQKIRPGSVDLLIMVRVLHHISDLAACFKIMNTLVKDEGYLILEFANKEHLKATLSEFMKGNVTFPLDISPKEVRSENSKAGKTLPFLNYHPDLVKEELEEAGFKSIFKLSVSNIRSPLVKRILSTNTLVSLEKNLQRPLSYINFGPSIFVLAKKTT